MISGYLGPDLASAHLLEMTRRQEFIFGGFYTGIATLAGDKLRRVRTVGSVAALEANEYPLGLQGSIGIAHSRTDDGGGIEWSQPRFDIDGRIASVGVGTSGVFDSKFAVEQLAEELIESGAFFRTRSLERRKNSIGLKDGASIHRGEVLLRALAAKCRAGHSLLASFRALNMRSESIGLYLFQNHPQSIFVVNQNQRLLVGRFGDGVFLATSRLAFPCQQSSNREATISFAEPDWLVEIPINTLATVTLEGVNLEQLWEHEPRFERDVPLSARAKFVDFIKANPGCSWYQAVSGLESALSKGNATMATILGHRFLEDLLSENVLRFKILEATGMEGQAGVPQMALFYNEPKRHI